LASCEKRARIGVAVAVLTVVGSLKRGTTLEGTRERYGTGVSIG